MFLYFVITYTWMLLATGKVVVVKKGTASKPSKAPVPATERAFFEQEEEAGLWVPVMKERITGWRTSKEVVRTAGDVKAKNMTSTGAIADFKIPEVIRETVSCMEPITESVVCWEPIEGWDPSSDDEPWEPEEIVDAPKPARSKNVFFTEYVDYQEHEAAIKALWEKVSSIPPMVVGSTGPAGYSGARGYTGMTGSTGATGAKAPYHGMDVDFHRYSSGCKCDDCFDIWASKVDAWENTKHQWDREDIPFSIETVGGANVSTKWNVKKEGKVIATYHSIDDAKKAVAHLEHFQKSATI